MSRLSILLVALVAVGASAFVSFWEGKAGRCRHWRPAFALACALLSRRPPPPPCPDGAAAVSAEHTEGGGGGDAAGAGLKVARTHRTTMWVSRRRAVRHATPLCAYLPPPRATAVMMVAVGGGGCAQRACQGGGDRVRARAAAQFESRVHTRVHVRILRDRAVARPSSTPLPPPRPGTCRGTLKEGEKGGGYAVDGAQGGRALHRRASKTDPPSFSPFSRTQPTNKTSLVTKIKNTAILLNGVKPNLTAKAASWNKSASIVTFPVVNKTGSGKNWTQTFSKINATKKSVLWGRGAAFLLVLGGKKLHETMRT